MRASRLLVALLAIPGCVADPADMGGGDDDVVDPPPPPVDTAPVAAARPAMAWGGNSHLAVWDTPRNGGQDIYGTRVAADGRVLDPDGIAIGAGAGDQFTPRVAWNGQVFLVVWKDSRAGEAIYGARVDLDGKVLDPAGIAIATDGGASQFPDVASDGRDFLVVWEGPCGLPSCEHGVSGAIVSGAGVVGAPMRIAGVAALSYTPRVAYASGGYVVTWAEIAASGAHDVHARRVASTGALGADLAVSTAASNQIAPAIASNGTSFFVAWQDTRDGAPRTYGARLGAEGAVVDRDGIALSAAGRWRDPPDVAFANGAFVVAWTEPVGDAIALRTARVDATGAVASGATVVSMPSAGGSPLLDDKHPVLSASPAGATIAWQDAWDDEQSTVYGGRLGASHELVDEQVLSTMIVP